MMNFNLSGSSAVAASVLAVALWGAPASHAADGNTLRLQGTMQVNAGEGEQALQSHATVVDPRLGEKAATRLGTAQGQQSLADANASIGAKSGVKVSSSDVQAMANAMAGRTVYTNERNTQTSSKATLSLAGCRVAREARCARAAQSEVFGQGREAHGRQA
ncbi:MAG: hypothetical protein R3E55_04570 [Burkholderiaceae bacterium]